MNHLIIDPNYQFKTNMNIKINFGRPLESVNSASRGFAQRRRPVEQVRSFSKRFQDFRKQCEHLFRNSKHVRVACSNVCCV